MPTTARRAEATVSVTSLCSVVLVKHAFCRSDHEDDATMMIFIQKFRRLLKYKCPQMCGRHIKLDGKKRHHEFCKNGPLSRSLIHRRQSLLSPLLVPLTCPLCEDSVAIYPTTASLVDHLTGERHGLTWEREDIDTSRNLQAGKRRRATPQSRGTVALRVYKDERGAPIEGRCDGIVYRSAMFDHEIDFLVWSKTERDGAHFGVCLLTDNHDCMQNSLQVT